MSGRLWWEYPLLICLYRLPNPSLWMLMIKRHLNYWRCKTKNRWRSVDAHFQDGAGSLLHSLFHIKVGITLFMTVWNQSPHRLPTMQNQKLLMLHWGSFSRWGREHVRFSFSYKGGQYFIYDCLEPITTQITKDARPKNCCCTVDAHYQDGVESVLLLLLPIKAANTLVMYNHNQINF